MRPLRRLLARTLLAPFLLLPLLSCGYPKPSSKAVAEALGRTSNFADPLTVSVPRRIEAVTEAQDGGGALDGHQLTKIDAVVAILRANNVVDVHDVYGPDGTTRGYLHILTIAPAADQPAESFLETEQPFGAPAWTRIKKSPGWRVTLGRREVTKVWQILDAASPNADRLSPGYIQADFDFRWVPNEIGKLFDQGSLSFDDLPGDLQRAMMQVALDSRATYSGRAWLTRDKKNGDWMVTLFDCRRRCPGQS